VTRLVDPATAGLADILAVLAAEPELRALNAAVPRAS
jgi:hypothetical protein